MGISVPKVMHYLIVWGTLFYSMFA